MTTALWNPVPITARGGCPQSAHRLVLFTPSSQLGVTGSFPSENPNHHLAVVTGLSLPGCGMRNFEFPPPWSLSCGQVLAEGQLLVVAPPTHHQGPDPPLVLPRPLLSYDPRTHIHLTQIPGKSTLMRWAVG